MFLARAKDTNNGDRLYLEADPEAVAHSLESGDITQFFFVDISTPATNLQPVTVKAGLRRKGVTTEFVEIIADGNIVGEILVNK